MKTDTLIIGGGATGLGAAIELRTESCLFEAEARLGGCLRSDFVSGYTVDRTGHLMHFRDDYVRGVVFDRLKLEWLHFNRNAAVHLLDRAVPYPIQYNLHALPEPERAHCLKTFLARPTGEPSLHSSFETWSRSSFGDGLYELFFAPYNRKLWQADLKSFSAEWAQRFVPLPDIQLVMQGAKEPHPDNNFGYNATFSYPRSGGSQAIIDALAKESAGATHAGAALVSLDTESRICEFSNGARVHYRELVSTIPVGKLLRLIHNADSQIVELGNQLRHNSLLYFAFGFDTGGEHPSAHWIYVPEPKFLIYRVGVLSNYSPEIAPKNCVLLCAEIAFPGDTARFADPGALRDKILADLQAIGIVRPHWKLNFEHHDTIDCAYVIFDEARRRALPRILNYLKQKSIHSIGRYGAWDYGSIGDALLEGRDCAHAINQSFGTTD